MDVVHIIPDTNRSESAEEMAPRTMFAVANELCANLKGGSWNRYTHERIAIEFSLAILANNMRMQVLCGSCSSS